MSPDPVLLDAKGRCPPGDMDGTWGHDDFLEALADPDHESHAGMKVRAGRNYNPEVVASRPLQRLSSPSPRHGRANHRPSASQPAEL